MINYDLAAVMGRYCKLLYIKHLRNRAPRLCNILRARYLRTSRVDTAHFSYVVCGDYLRSRKMFVIRS